MSGGHKVPAQIRHSKRLQEIKRSTLLGVCASMKPAPGRDARSAVRSLLVHSLTQIGTVYPDVSLLDLRESPVPFFDGRLPREHDDAALTFALNCIERAGALMLSVPAYWSGVSGVFKNFIDVLCGPVYDMKDEMTTVFDGKPTGLLIVGADHESAQAGVAQARQILRSIGASLVGEPVVVANPRSADVDMAAVGGDLIALGAELARHAHIAGKRGA